MNSPFTNFTGQDFETVSDTKFVSNNVIIGSPFLETPFMSEELEEDFYEETSEEDMDEVYEEEIENITDDYSPEMENDLPDHQKKIAASANDLQMHKLGWGPYLDKILGWLKMPASPDAFTYYMFHRPEFVDAIAQYQNDKYKEKKGFKKVSKNKGVLELSTWSEMQNDFGWLKIQPQPLSEKAISHAKSQNFRLRNKRLKKTGPWGKSILGWISYKNFIIQQFSQEKIIDYNLDLDDKYFALVLASWQRRNSIKKINGIMDVDTWGKMFDIILQTNPKFKLLMYASKPGQAAHHIFMALQKMEANLVSAFNLIKTQIGNDLEITDDATKGDVLKIFLNTVISVVAGAKDSVKYTVAGTILNGVIDSIKAYYDKENDAQAQDIIRSSKKTLAELIFSLSINHLDSTYENDLEVHISGYFDQIKKTLSSKDFAEKEKLEYTYLQNLIGDINEKGESRTFLKKKAVISLINTIAKTRLIVDCNNDDIIAAIKRLKLTQSISNWSKEDVRFYSKEAKLEIDFVKKLPEPDMFWELNPIEERIVKTTWTYWQSEGLTIKDLLLEKHVYFRVRLDNGHELRPYEVLVKTMGVKESKKWETYDTVELEGKSKDIISLKPVYNLFFAGIGHFPPITKNVKEKNSNNYEFKSIITYIVNTVMEREYNRSDNSKNISYIVYENEFEKNKYPYTLEQFVESGETNDHYHNKSRDIWNESKIYETNFEDHAELESDGTQFEIEEYQTPPSKSKAPILIRRLHSGKAYSIFDPSSNSYATKQNQIQLKKSGLSFAAIQSALAKTIDLNAIQQLLASHNQLSPGNTYQFNPGSTDVDAVFTEAIHQFQIANYLDPNDQDGVIGRSTLETLGFTDHKLKGKLNSSGFYGQGILNDNKKAVAAETSNEFTAANWYQFILKPSWLGVKITDGIHVLLYRKLQEAETWLLSQPQYKGMTPAALGSALGFTADTRYSGARLSSGKQAMHGFGLALDINVSGNPWIGAGWVKNDKVLLQERYRMIKAFRNAATDNSLPGSTVFAYLDSIAASAGDDTSKAYAILKQRNDQFITYLKSNASELSYWKKSQTFGNRNPLNGFLNLHPDLVYALRQIAGLAWGAIDFGPNASGDIMHFDMRTIGVGKLLCKEVGGFVPRTGHPFITKEIFSDEVLFEELEEEDFLEESAFNEAIENEEWEDYNYEDETKRSYANYTQKPANIFLTLTGEKQGQIKGNILQKGKEGMIAVYAFHHEITSPRDAASGMATGKRMHKPIVLSKEADMSSTKLLSALVNNERLKQVNINFWKPASMGKTGGSAMEINYYRITLTNAFVSNISQDRSVTPELNELIMEKVELVYEKIEWQYLEG